MSSFDWKEFFSPPRLGFADDKIVLLTGCAQTRELFHKSEMTPTKSQ